MHLIGIVREVSDSKVSRPGNSVGPVECQCETSRLVDYSEMPNFEAVMSIHRFHEIRANPKINVFLV